MYLISIIDQIHKYVITLNFVHYLLNRYPHVYETDKVIMLYMPINTLIYIPNYTPSCNKIKVRVFFFL